jgi:hypothetical protein
LSDTFTIQNADALLPLPLNSTLEFAIRKVQERQIGLTLLGTHELVVYSADENVLGDNINTMNSEEVGLEVNTEKCKCTIYIQIDNRSFESVRRFKIFGNDTDS